MGGVDVDRIQSDMEELKKSIGERLSKLDKDVKNINNLVDSEIITKSNLTGLIEHKVNKEDLKVLIPDQAQFEAKVKG